MVTRAVELATRRIEFGNQRTNTVNQIPYTKNCIVVVSSHAMRRSMLKLTCLRKKTVVFHPHPTMADRVTRASNATAHPGLVDCNPPRRSKEEVQAEKQARADAMARVEHEKNTNILKVAAFERAAKQKALQLEQAGDDPTMQMSRPRPRMVRPRPEGFDDGKDCNLRSKQAT
jgi:hypothetical protein